MIEHTRAQLAALAAAPDFPNAGWRLGVSDWVLEEVEETMENEERAVEYIQANYDRDDRIAIVLRNLKTGELNQRIRTAEDVCAPRYQAHLRAANATGSDVFIGQSALKPEATGRTKADIAVVRHVYLDVDAGGRAAVDAILSSPGVPPAHHMLATSPDKYQVIWSVRDFSVPEAEALMRGMAAAHGADPAAVDASRVLRLPGFRNWKNESPHYVRDVNTITAPRDEYTPADFPHYGESETRQLVAARAAKGATTGDPGVNTQSHRDWAWTVRQVAAGRDRGAIIAELAAARPEKPKPRYYAEHTVERAETYLKQQRSAGYAISAGAAW